MPYVRSCGISQKCWCEGQKNSKKIETKIADTKDGRAHAVCRLLYTDLNSNPDNLKVVCCSGGAICWRRLPSLSAEASPPRERQSGHAGASCEKSEIGARHLLVGTVARPSGRLSRRWSNPRPPGCFLRPPNRVPACPCPCPKKRISVMAITE